MTIRNRREEGFEVDIEGVCYSAPGRAELSILEDIDLRVRPGEFLTILGENGAGKSTLLSLISGQNSPTKGSIRVGNDYVDRPIHLVVDGVGIVHQNVDNDLVDHLSIAQNLFLRERFGGGGIKSILGVTNSWKRQMNAQLSRISPVSLPLDKIVSKLSGGEKQALSVLTAIHIEHKVNPCGLLLLDEHTSKLDHIRSNEVMSYTKEQVADSGCTTIMVSHRYSEAIEYSDRIIILRKGKIVAEIDSPESLSIGELRELVESE